MGRFDAALAFGQLGESVISKWLQGRGHAVFPAYQVEQHAGKGPQLFTASGDLVLPDLLAFKQGRAIWFEAKHKTCFAWNRTRREWVTGVDLRHYREYQEVAERTSVPVWLLFFHPNSKPSDNDILHGCPDACPTGLFGNDLSVLVNCESHRSDRYGKSGMVYWAHDVLRCLASVREVAA